MAWLNDFKCDDDDAIAEIESAFGPVDAFDNATCEIAINQICALYAQDLPQVLAAVLVGTIRHHRVGYDVGSQVETLLDYFATNDSTIEYNAVIRKVFGPESGLEGQLGDDDWLNQSKLEDWPVLNTRQSKAILCWISVVKTWTEPGFRKDDEVYQLAADYWLNRIAGSVES